MTKPDTRRPYSKWFWSNWTGNPKLRACSVSARGLWMDMLAIMHNADPKGYFLLNGAQPTSKQLAKIVGEGVDDIAAWITELETNGVFSKDRRGIIYSRRMLRDEKKATIARDNGQLGGAGKHKKNKGDFAVGKQNEINPLTDPLQKDGSPIVYSPESIVQNPPTPLPDQEGENDIEKGTPFDENNTTDDTLERDQDQTLDEPQEVATAEAPQGDGNDDAPKTAGEHLKSVFNPETGTLTVPSPKDQLERQRSKEAVPPNLMLDREKILSTIMSFKISRLNAEAYLNGLRDFMDRQDIVDLLADAKMAGLTNNQLDELIVGTARKAEREAAKQNHNSTVGPTAMRQWGRVSQTIRGHIGEADYRTFIAPIRLEAVDATSVTLKTSPAIANQLKSTELADEIAELWAAETGNATAVKIMEQ